MATKMVVTCDACGVEIAAATKPIYLSATRWESIGGRKIEGFDGSEFCGQQCAVNAVVALLNGNA